MTDPVEKIIVEALDAAGVDYLRDVDHKNGKQLDFYLKAPAIFIECCQFHTGRKIEQLRDVDDVVLVQGMRAAEWLADLVRDTGRGELEDDELCP